MKPAENIFERTTPEAVGITSASVLNLLDEIERRHINFHSLMVLRHGKAAVNMWWKPYSPDIPHQQYSFSKSILSAAVGIACSEKLLSLDDRITSFFPRRINQEADDRIYSVTVENLLTMTSGAMLQNEAGIGGRTDWVEWFLNTPLSSDPGERFIYNSMNSYMLAAILRRLTGESLVDYLMPRLFEPLGIARPVWDRCPMGIECGGWGLYLRTEDMAKFCQLCLNDGMWKEQRLLPEGWAAEAGSDHTAGIADDSKLNDSIHRTEGYGYHFWRNGDGKSWRADGMFGQYGVIIPEKDMVIVTTGGHARQMEMLEVLYDAFIPYVDDIPEGSVAGSDYDELCTAVNKLSCPRPLHTHFATIMQNWPAEEVYDFPHSRHGLLPLAVRYLHRAGTLGVRSVRFDIIDGHPVMYWKEDGINLLIPFSENGDFCSCELIIGGRTYPAVTMAAWTAEDTLEISIRMIQMAHMQRVSFRFEDDELVCSFDEDPSLEDMLRMLFDMAQPMRPIAVRLARLTKRMIPSVRGRLRQETISKGTALV